MWHAHFYVRFPKRIVNVQEFPPRENYNRNGLFEELYRDRAASIERIKAQKPQAYDEIVADLGKEQADEKLLEYYAYRIMAAPEMGSDVERYVDSISITPSGR